MVIRSGGTPSNVLHLSFSILHSCKRMDGRRMDLRWECAVWDSAGSLDPCSPMYTDCIGGPHLR